MTYGTRGYQHLFHETVLCENNIILFFTLLIPHQIILVKEYGLMENLERNIINDDSGQL